jgi:hypothetical protein
MLRSLKYVWLLIAVVLLATALPAWAAPVLFGISPTSGYPGTQVTYTGTGFGATQGGGSVWLGNKLAGSIVSWSNTQIVAVVAATAATGSASVQQGTWSNSIAFTVIAPNITSVSPTSAYQGNQVTITGTNFGATQGTGSVWLGNKLAGSIVSWSNTQIVANVAATALSGSVQVQQMGVWGNSVAFTVITPNVTSVSPTTAYPGAQVTIAGTNFGATQGTGSVWLGNKLAGSIVSWSNTQIVATVAATAASGSASVQQGGVWSNSTAFTVIAPSLTSVSPTTARAGDSITLTGTNFGASQGTGSVWLGSKLAGSIVSWSNTQIVATVASGAVTGNAIVQQGGVWSNSIALTVLTPTLTSIDPDTARAGDSITLTGTNFGATQGTGSVWLGSKLAGSIVSWSNTQIVAIVASGSIPGTAQVQQGGVWSNNIAFTVIIPIVTVLSDTSGRPGEFLALNGTGFGDTQGDGKVWIGTKYATVASWSDTLVYATVALDAESGNAQIYQNGVWSNTLPFDVVDCPVAEDPDDLDPEDVVWIDDDGVPAGTTVGSEGIVWDSYQKMHGTMAFHAVDAGQGTVGLRTVSFTGLNASIAANHTLFLDVLSEECAPAQQVIVTWQTDDGPRTAYWGTNVQNLGSEAVQISEDLEAGYWQRLQVDPHDLDMIGRTVTGITVEHVDGRVWFDYIGVNVPPPCGPPAPADVTEELNPLDVVFVEDAFPAGTTVGAPGIVWDTTYHAGGTQSFTHASPDFEQPQAISLTGFDPSFPVNRNDTLFVWVLIDGCEIPRQLKVTWKTSAGDKVVWYGSNGDFYGTGGVYGGSMPQVGQWRRLAVTANALNIYNGSIDGVVLENYGGHVWWDHAGHTLGNGCLTESWQDRPNTLHNDDELWIDEAFPAGSTLDAPGLEWSDRQRSTGDLSFNYPSLDSHAPQHISLQGFAPIEIDPEGFLFAYIFQNQCNPPLQIALTWATSAGPKSAYWGPNLLNVTGVDMGPLPTRRRSWERLEVPASLLGIEEGDTVTGFTIDQYGGHSFFDTIGARSECILTEIAAVNDFEPADMVRIDDTSPVGVVAHDVDFVTDQKTSGTASFTSTDSDPAGVNTFSFDFPANFFELVEGDSILFYVLLDPCNPPREIRFKFTGAELTSAIAYGDPIIDPGYMYGPILPSGVWQRVEIPISGFRPEVPGPVTLEIAAVDGRIWIDRFGKSCSATPTIENRSIDDGDVFWFESELPAGATATPGIVWEPERALGSTSSFTSVNASSYGTHTIDLSDLGPHLIGSDDSLIFYAHTDHCPPSSQIAVTWHLENGQTRSAWWGGASGTGHHGGDVVLGWGRYMVPATTLDIVGEEVVGITFVNEGGRASYNRVGVHAPACIAATATAPVLPPGEVVWFEDGWSTSAAPQYTDGRWDPRQHASGTAAVTAETYGQFQSGLVAAQNFTGTPLPALQAGSEVVMWVFIDPCDIPEYIQIAWTTSLGSRTFYWGSTPNIYGTPMGPMPAAGSWARLAMPVDAELDGAIPTGILASWHSAQVWFDRIGATSGTCAANPVVPILPTAAQTWMEDELPAGATGSSGTWVTTQYASGTHSLLSAGAGRQTFEISVPAWSVGASESLGFTMLVDPCAETPREIVVSYLNTETGQWARAFWGTDIIGAEGAPVNLNMGAVPAADEWQVIELDPSLLGLETDDIIGLRIETIGGRVWFDYFNTHTP